MNPEHLSDESLNAFLDKEATSAAESEHLLSCSECRARLDSLRSVAQLVAESAPIPSQKSVDDAVSRALQAQGGPQGAKSTVRSIGSSAWLIGAAAAALFAVVSAPLFLKDEFYNVATKNDDTSSTATPQASTTTGQNQALSRAPEKGVRTEDPRPSERVKDSDRSVPDADSPSVPSLTPTAQKTTRGVWIGWAAVVVVLSVVVIWLFRRHRSP